MDLYMVDVSVSAVSVWLVALCGVRWCVGVQGQTSQHPRSAVTDIYQTSARGYMYSRCQHMQVNLWALVERRKTHTRGLTTRCIRCVPFGQSLG